VFDQSCEVMGTLASSLVVGIHSWQDPIKFQSLAGQLAHRGFGNARHASNMVTVVVSGTSEKDVRQGLPREHVG
jgi:hypothetical protein